MFHLRSNNWAHLLFRIDLAGFEKWLFRYFCTPSFTTSHPYTKDEAHWCHAMPVLTKGTRVGGAAVVGRNETLTKYLKPIW